MDLKEKIKINKIDRRDIADHLGVSYHVLSHKLNRFSKWKDGEVEKIEQYIESVKNVNP